MTDETQFKHNARGKDLNKKRDELNTYIADYGHAEVFNRGFDAAVEILSEEIKELENALEWIAKGPTWGIGAPSLEEQAHSQAKKAQEALANRSKLRGGK